MRSFRPTLSMVAASLCFFFSYPILGQQVVSLEGLLGYRHLGNVRMAPDGTQAVFVAIESDLERNASNAHLWVTDFSSRQTRQLTVREERVAAPTWSPDGSQIAFLSNRSGPRQIWTMAPDGGEPPSAVPAQRLNITHFHWLPDGTGFAFLAPDPPIRRAGTGPLTGAGPGARRPPPGPIVVDANPRYQRLYRQRVGEGQPELLTAENDHVTSFDVSADGGWVAMTTQPRPGPGFGMQSDVKLLGLASGDAIILVTSPTPIAAPQFSPDGQWVAFVSRDDPNANVLHNRYLQVVRADGSERRTLTRSVDENVLGFEWAGDGKSLVFWVYWGVANKAYRVERSGGEPQLLQAFAQDWSLERGEGVSFGNDGGRGAAALSNSESPAEVYLLEGGGRQLRRVTAINQAFAALAPQTEVLRYESDDGLALEALVVKPRDFQAGRRYPLLVVVHGGPPSVFSDAFAPRRGVYPIHAFANAGYVLLLPNPRGSTGYGERFRQANIRELGGGDFRDIMTGVDRLIEDGVADSSRMGMMGWSYGGQMSYWTLTHTDRFRAISAGAGIANLASHHGTGQAKGYGQHDAYWGVTPWEDPQIFIESSALFYIEHAKTPLLIQHGQNDTIVPVSQAHEFYAAAKRVGLPVEMVIYPGQPHVIQSPRFLLDGMQRNLAWFNRWLFVE